MRFIMERPEEGRLQDAAWGSAFPVLFGLLSCFVFLFFFGGGIGGKENGLPHLDGRAPHAFTWKYRLGAGLRGS